MNLKSITILSSLVLLTSLLYADEYHDSGNLVSVEGEKGSVDVSSKDYEQGVTATVQTGAKQATSDVTLNKDTGTVTKTVTVYDYETDEVKSVKGTADAKVVVGNKVKTKGPKVGANKK